MKIKTLFIYHFLNPRFYPVPTIDRPSMDYLKSPSYFSLCSLISLAFLLRKPLCSFRPPSMLAILAFLLLCPFPCRCETGIPLIYKSVPSSYLLKLDLTAYDLFTIPFLLEP